MKKTYIKTVASLAMVSFCGIGFAYELDESKSFAELSTAQYDVIEIVAVGPKCIDKESASFSQLSAETVNYCSN